MPSERANRANVDKLPGMQGGSHRQAGERGYQLAGRDLDFLEVRVDVVHVDNIHARPRANPSSLPDVFAVHPVAVHDSHRLTKLPYVARALSQLPGFADLRVEQRCKLRHQDQCGLGLDRIQLCNFAGRQMRHRKRRMSASIWHSTTPRPC